MARLGFVGRHVLIDGSKNYISLVVGKTQAKIPLNNKKF